MSNLFMLDCGIQIDPMVPAFVRLLINAIKIIVPIVLIIFGIVEMLKAATANDEDCYKSCLINNGIYDYFDFILDVSLFKHGKEKPDIYLASAKKLKLNVNECAVFEDLLLALKTAKEAGFKCVAVYEETCQDEEQKKKIADMYITDYKDIIDI